MGLPGFTGGPYFPAFIKRSLNMLERKRKTNVQHYGKPDNLWACFEVAERRVYCHLRTLQFSPISLNRV